MKKLLTKALQAIAKVGEAMPKENAGVVEKLAEPKPWRISSFAVDIVKSMRPASSKKPAQAYTPPKGVIPDGEATTMAMDFAGVMGATPVFNAIEYAQQYNISMGFPGYAVLAELAQVSEYRSPVETIAKEMTRKWGEIKSTGDDDRSEQIKQIVAEFNRLGVKEVCRQLIEHDGFYGRAQVYIDLEMPDDDELPLTVSSKTIKQGSLKRLKAIEPMWTAAQQYNADNPLNPNFYKPSMWFLFGKKIHDSRLITIVSRPVPDMLKPAYNFGGISLTQLIVPYVDNWLSSRQTVNELLRKFSTSGFKTEMGNMLSGGSDTNTLVNRAEIFNAFRDNFGALILDNKEEFFQFNVPLSGIDRLQSQAQEQMAAPTHIPLVKLFGITPSGLNATSEGEIQVWHEYLRAEQENVLDKPVHKILQIVQLSLFGEIYDDIVFEWNPLAEMTEEQQANVNKTKADTGAVLIEAGVIDNAEERTRIATDPMSGYNSLDVADVPEMPEGEMMDDDDGEIDSKEETADPEADSTE